MNKVKQGFGILLFSGLLMAAAAAPITFMMYENNRMFNHVNVTALPDDGGNEQTGKQSYNVRERLNVIRESPNVIRQRQDVIAEEKKNNILGHMEEELAKLAEAGCLPKWAFPEEYPVSVYKNTYIVPQNPSESISLWVIQARYSEYTVHAYMDADISVLYGLNIASDEGTLSYAVPEQLEEKFFTYLQLDLGAADKRGERFCVDSYYSDNVISLFIATYDEKSQKINSFNFGEQGVTGYKTIEEYAPSTGKVTESEEALE